MRIKLVVTVLAVVAAVSVLSGGTRRPRARVFVTNEVAGTLTVLDADRGRPIATVRLGKRPRGIKLSPDEKHVYVALSGSAAAGPGVDESRLPPPDRRADG